MRELERRVTLSVLDRKWREHLYEMDYLKEGIGLRAMAQRTRWSSTSARASTCSTA
jgi:preprotein translocase subunit SecA